MEQCENSHFQLAKMQKMNISKDKKITELTFP